MTNDMASVAALLATLVLTYWIHSTLAVLAVWALTRGRESSTLHDRLWKFAAMVGLVSAPLQACIVSSLERAPTTTHVADVAAMSSAPQPSRVEMGEREAAPGIGLDSFSFPELANDGGGLLIQESSGAASMRSDSPVEPGMIQDVEHGAVISSADWAAAEIDGVAEQAPSVLAPPTEPAAVTTLEPESSGTAASDWAVSTWLAEENLAAVGVVLAAVPMVCLPFGGLLIGLRALALRRRARAARPLQGAVRRELDKLLAENAIRREVRLLTSDQYAEPVAFGAFRWTIVLPKGIEKKLDAPEIRALLAHELGHLVRGDVVWLWAGQAICLCLPFQPLNFFARRRWQSASEFLCDEWAVARGVDGLTLARCLAQVAEWRIERRCHVSLAASGDSDSTVARVQRLVDAKRQGDPWATRRGFVGLATAASMLTALIIAVTPIVAFPANMADVPNESAARGREAAGGVEPSEAVDFSSGSEATAPGAEFDPFVALAADLKLLKQLLEKADLTSEERAIAERIARRAEAIRAARESLVK